ncbi:MAG: TolC family protein [Rhodobacteraceae bacterium]|nr:TolC family protein [Paracoccaceae bacterium]
MATETQEVAWVDFDRSRERLRSCACIRTAIRTALFGIVQELRHARTELDALEGEILPEAETALKLAREGVAQARYSQLELLAAQRTLLGLRHERIDAAISFHQLVVQIEKLLGGPLSTPRPGPNTEIHSPTP